jgi:hypothetical protein
MAKVPGVTEHDHPLARLRAGGKPPKPPMPKAKVKPKAKKRGKKS